MIQNIVDLAATLASVFHERHRYYNQPLIAHLDRVRDILDEHGFRDKVVAAAYLQYALEETTYTEEQLFQAVPSPDVLFLVKALTAERGRYRREQRSPTYPKIRAAGTEAIAIKLATYLANLRYLTENEIQDQYPEDFQELIRVLEDGSMEVLGLRLEIESRLLLCSGQ